MCDEKAFYVNTDGRDQQMMVQYIIGEYFVPVILVICIVLYLKRVKLKRIFNGRMTANVISPEFVSWFNIGF